MNVIFLDFDGVVCTSVFQNNADIEAKIILLKEICDYCNASVVITSIHKNSFDPITLEPIDKDAEYAIYVMDTLKKHNVPIIGMTPTLNVEIASTTYYLNKGYEILKYLSLHPEIENYCIIDDEENKICVDDELKEHLLLVPYDYKNPNKSGLLPIHKEEIFKILNINKKEKNK